MPARPDRAAYDRSTIDWPRLHAYAKKVAKETTVALSPPITYWADGSQIQALGPQWPLDKRQQAVEHRYSQTRERIFISETLALRPDGTLINVWVQEEEILDSRGRSASRHFSHGHHSPPSEHEITRLDFEKKYRESSDVWGDHMPGDRLLRHSKGVGLSLWLRQLLSDGGSGSER